MHAILSGSRREALTASILGLAVVGLGSQDLSQVPADPAPPGAVTSGEQDRDGAGPLSAPVDHAHATPAAARAAAYAAHHHPEGASVTTATVLDPAVYGQWSTLSYRLPLRAVHATLLRTGKLLLVAGSGNVAGDHAIKNFKAYLWDPSTNALTSVPVPYDAFCAGHVVDPDGNVLVLGGTSGYRTSTSPWKGSAQVWKFHVDTSTWEKLPAMKQARWYPTTVLGAGGRVYTYAGYDRTGVDPQTPERYDPSTGTSTLLARLDFPLYPSLHLLRDGRLAYTGAHYGSGRGAVRPKVFNPQTGVFTYVANPAGVIDVTHRNMAMSALVGSADQQLAWVAGGLTAVRSTYFTDFTAATPTAVAGPDLAAAKGYVSISDLPDLTALETGGGTGLNSPVYEASILTPSSRTLSAVAPPSVGRTYHSSSLTLPDGRVATFGGDPSGDANFELRVEIYSPPYLFKGTRPAITAAPTEVHHGGTLPVTATAAAGATPTKVVILRPGSATHSMDANQRVLQLASTPTAGGRLATLPTNANLAPPGWYLLFVDDSLGRPSVGRWIHLT
jgi:hypothetical protein